MIVHNHRQEEIDQIVIYDRACRRVIDDNSVGRLAQGEPERPVLIMRLVADDRDSNGLRRFARGKGQRPHGGRVMRAGNGAGLTNSMNDLRCLLHISTIKREKGPRYYKKKTPRTLRGVFLS